MIKEGSTKNVNLMTPGLGVLVVGCGHKRHMVKMHYFLKSLFLYTQIRQPENIVIMTKEESLKIVNFITSGAQVIM